MGAGGQNILTDRITLLERKLEKQSKEYLGEKIDLIDQINNLNNEIIKYKREIENLNSSYKQLSDELNIKNQRLEEKINENDNLKQENDNIKQENEKLKKDIEQLKNELQKANVDKDFLEKEKQNLENENNNLKYSKMVLEESSKFLNTITNNKIELSIKNKYRDSLNKIIENNYEQDEFLIKNEKFKKKIEEYKDTNLKKSIEQFLNKTKHINVILLGKCGVGKSTLINALLGRDEAEEGGFTPVTDKTKYYEAGHLRLYDTVGIELSEEKSHKKILEDIKKIIKDSEKKDPDWFIHCIWYCIKGSRFELIEKKIIDDLMNTYKDGKMPIVIAYLHATDQEETNKMESGIKGIYPNFDFIPIIAKRILGPNGMVTEASGLIEIKEKTIFRFGDTINTMSFVHIQNKAKQLVFKNIENLTGSKDLNNLFTSVCDLYKKLVDELNENDKQKIKENLNTIIEYCKEIDFSDEINKYIQTFKDDINKNKNVEDKNNETKSANNFRRTKPFLKKINPELENILGKIKNELEAKFNKCKNEPNIKFNEEIYNYFLTVIKKTSGSFVEESLKNIKEELKNEMKEAINKSPNFNELLNKKK